MCGIAGISLKNKKKKLSKDFLKISNIFLIEDLTVKDFFKDNIS